MKSEAAFRVVIQGPSACFPRPEFRRDEVTYDILTPAAARGILDHIHWRPAIRWVIDSMGILNPIAFAESRSSNGRRSIALRDVRYVVDAHFETTARAGRSDEPIRHRGMFRRKIRSGARIYLGSELHPGEAILAEDIDDASDLVPIALTRDLGWIVHGADYEDRGRLRFFRAMLEDGVLAVPAPGSGALFG